MKVIVAGASGFVGTELIRQSVRMPSITSVIALSRTPVTIPDTPDAESDYSKLHNVTVEDYGIYSADVIKQLAGADACIWTVAIAASKCKEHDWKTVQRVCQGDTVSGFKAMIEAHESAGTERPFRFLYISGIAAERDQSKTPSFMPEYLLMRGETENRILALASESNGQVEACVAKPGFITAPIRNGATANGTTQAAKWGVNMASIAVTDIAAAMLNQVVNGFEKEPLLHEDLERLGSIHRLS